jgi:hypothetical protein
VKAESLPVKIAKESLNHFMKTGRVLSVSVETLTPDLKKQAGVFVSIKKNGQLRGCIGTIFPTQSNAAGEIIRNAVSAATEDPRFPKVLPSEVPMLEVSVDILGSPEKIEFMSELDPKRFGVIVRRGRLSGLLLPDLEGVDTVEEQVEIACRKAGIHHGESIEMYRFEVVRYR